jgi:hypothetical protein
MISEYGSIGPIRFLNPENVRMYDGNGNVILCKCGKPAGSGAIGKEAFIAWCSDCFPGNKEGAKLTYKMPKNSDFVSDSYIVDCKLKEKEI